jgi:8-oxo-dGTP pyrophosphatase MutT (NUDIX family)
MHLKDSHCCYCGVRYQAGAGWPRDCLNCGNRVYRNPLPVVVVLVPVAGGLVGIRRNIEPRKGTVTLPGGFLEVDESWQEGGKRELLEETGIDVGEGDLRLYEVMNGLDGTLIIFGVARPQPRSILKPFVSEETLEVLLIEGPMELGFEMHTKIVARYFRERQSLAEPQRSQRKAQKSRQ